MILTSVKKYLAIFLSTLLIFTFSVASQSASAATPKAGAKCTENGKKVTANNLTFTCKYSGKKLLWSKGIAVKISKQVVLGGDNSVTEGNLCDPAQSMTAKSNTGATLACTKGQDGKSSWRSPSEGQGQGKGQGQGQSQSQSQGEGNNNSNNKNTEQKQSGSFALGQLGAPCSKDGELGWNGLLVAVCKSGKVRYALATDVPKTPSGGYTSRPIWYPTLAQIMGGNNAAEPKCSPSSVTFTKPVVPLDKMAASIPYGMMVSGHVTPIDHGYFGITTLAKAQSEKTEADWIPVTAPADGTITELSSLGTASTSRVVIDHGCNLYSVYMVLNKPSGVLASYVNELAARGSVNLSIKVKAGDEFGRQRDNMLDFNVFDGTQWLSGFANPQAYLSAETWKPYTADFLPFFAPEIRSGIEKWMQRTSSPRSGKIDYDVIGAASGNWFIDGTNGYSGIANSVFENATSIVGGGQIAGKNDYSWSHLAIAPHEVDNSQWIFSTGWFNDPKGDATQLLLIVGAGQITPDKLTSANGAVTYQLAQASPIEPAGSPLRTPGSMAPWAVGYKIGAGASKGNVTLQVNSDNSMSVQINSTDKRTYRR
ncbi:MAG: hypothetical protein WCI68_00520 [Actinomycetes bacterium]|jgi:hypothetical protein|nr:hypothetical protein [Actinomycetota bacterium]